MAIISAVSRKITTLVDGTLRLTIDIEVCDANNAFSLFSHPGTPLAITRLSQEAAQKQAQDRIVEANKTIDKPKGGALSKLAGIWCQDDSFYHFIIPIYDKLYGGDGFGFGDLDDETRASMTTEDICRHCILVMCEIESRAELDHNPRAADRFNRLIRFPYMEYMNNLGTVSRW